MKRWNSWIIGTLIECSTLELVRMFVNMISIPKPIVLWKYIPSKYQLKPQNLQNTPLHTMNFHFSHMDTHTLAQGNNDLGRSVNMQLASLMTLTWCDSALRNTTASPKSSKYPSVNMWEQRPHRNHGWWSGSSCDHDGCCMHGATTTGTLHKCWWYYKQLSR